MIIAYISFKEFDVDENEVDEGEYMFNGYKFDEFANIEIKFDKEGSVFSSHVAIKPEDTTSVRESALNNLGRFMDDYSEFWVMTEEEIKQYNEGMMNLKDKKKNNLS